MERASITEAKNRLSALIDRVRQGAEIVIEDRGIPVARLEPVVSPTGRGVEGRSARLVRQGIARAPRKQAPRRLLAADPPARDAGPTLSDALLVERRSGR